MEIYHPYSLLKMDNLDLNSLVAFSRLCLSLKISHDMQVEIFSYFIYKPTHVLSIQVNSGESRIISDYDISNKLSCYIFYLDAIHDMLDELINLNFIDDWWDLEEDIFEITFSTGSKSIYRYSELITLLLETNSLSSHVLNNIFAPGLFTFYVRKN